MAKMMREGLALASVGVFVWMVFAATHLAG